MKKIFLFIFFSYWIFFILIPPFQTPDEASHYEFVYWLSQGVYPLVPNGNPQIPHPSSIQQDLFKNLVQHDKYIPNFQKVKMSNLQKITDYSKAQKNQFRPYAGQAYNPPVYYIIGSIFLSISRLLHTSLLGQIYVTRLTSGLFYFLAVFVAYKVFFLLFRKESTANELTLFFALNPLFLQSAVGISPDIALVFFTTLFFYLVLRLQKKIIENRYTILAAFIVGLACLSKITGIILIPGFIAYLFFQTSNMKQLLRHTSIFLITFAVLVSPWLLFNFIHYHTLLVSLPAFGIPLEKGVHTSFIGAIVSSLWGFRHIFIHYSGFLGWNDVFPFPQIFIPYTILFVLSIFAGMGFLWKTNKAFEKLLIVSTGCLFLFFLSIDVIRKIYSHQGWEIGGRDALLIFLPLVIFTVNGVAAILRKKLELVAIFLSYFSIWYYFFILVFVLIPRYYV